MYSSEIEQYLKERNYYLNSNEIEEVINVMVNTQICKISYHSDSNYYEVWTSDGYYFKFGCKPYIRK